MESKKNTQNLKQILYMKKILLLIITDDAIQKSKIKSNKMKVGNWKMWAVTIQELLFTNDMMLKADLEETLQQQLRLYQEELKKANTKINSNKTKIRK